MKSAGWYRRQLERGQIRGLVDGSSGPPDRRTVKCECGMKAILPLFIFVDACGWEIIKGDPFAREFAPNRTRLNSVFGYSSACVPSILSGRWPEEHRNWCYFVYDPPRSPFKSLRAL